MEGANPTKLSSEELAKKKARLRSSITLPQKQFNLKLPKIFGYDFEDDKRNWHEKDITDYFNYGLNEDTFRSYIRKVKKWKTKFETSSEYNSNLYGLNRMNDSIPIEFGGFCNPIDKNLLKNEQDLDFFNEEEYSNILFIKNRYDENYQEYYY